uniref:Uncharacterized protein n=1 Tax=Caenorhabditis japonica TaxID=281687 RepID=A0A8R1EUL2_CAEJA
MGRAGYCPERTDRRADVNLMVSLTRFMLWRAIKKVRRPISALGSAHSLTNKHDGRRRRRHQPPPPLPEYDRMNTSTSAFEFGSSTASSAATSTTSSQPDANDHLSVSYCF